MTKATMLQSGAITARVPANRTRRSLQILALAATLVLHGSATAKQAPVPLGTDSSFAVLAYSGIFVTAPTTITGNIGSYPTESVTGLANATFLSGGNQSANAGVMTTAANDLNSAFNNAAGRLATTTYSGAIDLGGSTLAPGVYSDTGAAMAITGTLTLNAAGDPNAVWIFQASSLTTAAGSLGSPMSMIDLINGAQASHVYWEIASSATLGTYSDFAGTILAATSITADFGATVEGRLLAENGAVTLNGNTITQPAYNAPGVPDAGGTLLLLGSAVATLMTLRRRIPAPL